MKRISKKAAFTLIEVIIATTICGFAVVGCCMLVVHVLNTNYYDSGRILINNDMLRLTRAMTTDGVDATDFIIYGSFTDRTVKHSTFSGDMVVFVTMVTDPTSGTTATSKIVGYFRDATTASKGPVRRFEIDESPASTTAVLTLINNTYPTSFNTSSLTTVVPLAQDFGTETTFYNYNDFVVMIKSQINETGGFSTAQNTYNFSVTPRG